MSKTTTDRIEFEVNGFAVDAPIELLEQATPSTPSAGVQKIYVKSDGLHTLNSSGTESKLAVESTTATGDLLYRNSSGDLVPLAIGSEGEVVTVSGGLPIWAALAIAAAISWDVTILTLSTADVVLPNMQTTAGMIV